MAGLVLLLTALYLAAGKFDLSLAALKARFEAANPIGSFVGLIFLYTAVSLAPMAGRDVLKFVAALIFGAIGSTLLIWVGEIFSAVAGFYLGRSGARGLVIMLLGEKGRKFDEKLEKADFRHIVLLRILPITPYKFLNLAAGLTSVKAVPYLAGSAVGSFVRTAFFQTLFAYAGSKLIEHGITTVQLLIASVLILIISLAAWWILEKLGRRR